MNNLWCTNYSSVRTNTRFTVSSISDPRAVPGILEKVRVKSKFRKVENIKGVQTAYPVSLIPGQLQEYCKR